LPSAPLTPIVHYMDNRRQMQAGEIVYLDYGSDYEYYVSDITRTWPVSGRFTAETEKLYRFGVGRRHHSPHARRTPRPPSSRRGGRRQPSMAFVTWRSRSTPNAGIPITSSPVAAPLATLW